MEKKIYQWWTINNEGVKNTAYRNKEKAEMVAKQMKEAGLNVEVEPIDVIDFEPKVRK